MKTDTTLFHLFIALFCACVVEHALGEDTLGRFSKEQDLFLAHFDSKTDVDDIHSVAAVATMLADVTREAEAQAFER